MIVKVVFPGRGFAIALQMCWPPWFPQTWETRLHLCGLGGLCSCCPLERKKAHSCKLCMQFYKVHGLLAHPWIQVKCPWVISTKKPKSPSQLIIGFINKVYLSPFSRWNTSIASEGLLSLPCICEALREGSVKDGLGHNIFICSSQACSFTSATVARVGARAEFDLHL